MRHSCPRASCRPFANMFETHPFKAAVEPLVRRGLVAYEWSKLPEKPAEKLFVIRPSTAVGTPLRGWIGERILAIGSAYILTNAPAATITRDQASGRWAAEISINLIPGPPARYFHGLFETLPEAATALVECFFEDRVQYDDPRLQAWLKQWTSVSED